MYRVCHIGGYLGQGKTALAVYLADWLLRHGYADQVLSNTPLTTGRIVAEYEDWKSAVCGRFQNTVILYDESWIELGVGASQKTILSYMAYLRKDNSYLLLPSTHELTRGVCLLNVERCLNGLLFGLPLWRYEFWLGPRKPRKDLQKYSWWRPKSVFSLYDKDKRPGAWVLYRWDDIEVVSDDSQAD